jgi:hypothetical protein
VGNSALYLMALTDNAGLDDNRVKKLIDIYYAALDVGVTGEVLSLPSNLRPLIWPEWMRGRSKRTDINYRPSPPSSILGRLHCSLQRVLAVRAALKPRALHPSVAVRLSPLLCLTPALAHSHGRATLASTPSSVDGVCHAPGFTESGRSCTSSTASR